jgi:predicted RNase H-like HicB family nuclease
MPFTCQTITEAMSSRRFHVYLEKDKQTGLIAARCIELSVFSQARPEEEALKNIREAISLHLETLKDELRGKKFLEVEV